MSKMAHELLAIAKELTASRSRVAALSTLNMRQVAADYERKAFDQLAKRECQLFAEEVSKEIGKNRDVVPSAIPYHAVTRRVAMNMNGVNYFAQSVLSTPTWLVKLFFSQDNWECYAVILTAQDKYLDSVRGTSGQEIGQIIARRADELGLQ